MKLKSILFLLIVFTLCSWYQSDKSDLYYVVRPALVKQKQPPLLVLLHGYGSNEQDLFSLASQLPDSFTIVSVRAPQVLGKNSYAWYNMTFTAGKKAIDAGQAESSRLAILQFIDGLKQKVVFNPLRVYLCGFSQGAIMSISVALSAPDKIKGIAVLSGRLPDNIKTQVSKSAAVKQLNVFISHGTRDQVITIDEARSTRDYLKTLNITPAYKEYDDVHTINRNMLNDLVIWLKQQLHKK